MPRKDEERPVEYHGVRITFWYDPAEQIEEPKNKTVGRLKSKAINPDSRAPASNKVSMEDVSVDTKHWLGRMGRHENAH